jgi:hypothetical protein
MRHHGDTDPVSYKGWTFECARFRRRPDGPGRLVIGTARADGGPDAKHGGAVDSRRRAIPDGHVVAGLDQVGNHARAQSDVRQALKLDAPYTIVYGRYVH